MTFWVSFHVPKHEGLLVLLMIHLTKTKETLLFYSENTSFELQMNPIFPARQTSWEESGQIWTMYLCHLDALGC